MKVVAYDPFLSAERARSLNIEKLELDALLTRADIISLHTPLNDQTRHILNKKSLAKTKKGVCIINCARGGLVVEADLKEAIESGQVAAAAFDVFEEEPANQNVLFGLEQVICTPHLGASTEEAQENVAIQVAEQMADYLSEGTVMNALNMPSVSAEDAARLKPYLTLAHQLGSFAGQITETGLNKVSIEFEGRVAELNTRPLSSAALHGLLAPLMEGVNMVNAPIVAKERGIDVSEVQHERENHYKTLIRLTVTSDRRTRTVAGTLFGEQPRIVEINGVPLEAALSERMLYITNDDKPGMIGGVGQVLGEAGVNIANFHLGRNEVDPKAHDAIALLAVDQEVDAKTLKALGNLSSVNQVKSLTF